MARAHVNRPITDTEGNVLYGASVTVRESGLSVPIAQTLFASASGTGTLSNPFVADRGVVEFWLETPQRVSALVQLDGHDDILAYLDAAPPPEETARTDSPLQIVGAPTPGQVLLAGSTLGQAQWGAPPSSSGLTLPVTVIGQDFSAGQDPIGWSMIQQPTTLRSYVTDVPASQGLSRSLQAVHSGNNGKLTVTMPAFSLLEAGYIGLWIKADLAAGESVKVSYTKADTTVVVLETISNSRDWGYYRYPMVAGSYLNAKVEMIGAASFAGTSGHSAWMTGVKVGYGGQVPAHTHPGTGANSVSLGTGSTANGAGSVSVGVNAASGGVNAVAIGYGASAAGGSAVAIGQGTAAPNTGVVVVGTGASGNATVTNWVAVGTGAYADAANGVAVGYNSKAYGADSTAIGSAAYAGSGASGAVAIGQGSQALAASSTAIGMNTLVASGHANSTAIGDGAATTASSQIMLGATDSARQVVVSGRLTALGQVNLGTSGTSKLGFFGTEPVVKPTVTGSRSANAALQSVLTALAACGLLTDSSTT